MYEELKDKNFELIAVAEDTAGEEAAGPFYDAAKATYTALLDPRHTISALYDLVNVPTGILIDEEGVIVRIDEGAYTQEYSAGTFTFGTDDYVPIIRDWVAKGSDSTYVLSPDQLPDLVAVGRDDRGLADAHFRLGTYLEEQGHHEAAREQWGEAQRLQPESWNYHRQEWSYTPAEHGPKWFQKVQAQGDKPYYAPMVLPEGDENEVKGENDSEDDAENDAEDGSP